MVASNMPSADVEVDEALVRRLLASQHPDLAELPLRAFASGWDNVMFRLGHDLAVRVPRRAVAAALIEHEQRVLPLLAPSLPLPIPVPIRSGRPDGDHPYPWSVVPWFDGAPLGGTPFADPAAEARRLGSFLAALHVEAPADAPANPFRGHHIGRNDDVFRERLVAAAEVIEAEVPGGVDRMRRRWDRLRDVEPFRGTPRWLHGDLHALNLVERRGEVVAVVDWGDVCAGDPACDLSIAWALFDRDDRLLVRRAAGSPDDATWQRAEAWALHFCLTYFAHSADNADMFAAARRLVARLFSD